MEFQIGKESPVFPSVKGVIDWIDCQYGWLEKYLNFNDEVKIERARMRQSVNIVNGDDVSVIQSGKGLTIIQMEED